MCAPTKPLHFSCVFVLHGLACVVERPGLCLRRLQILSRVMGLLFMFFACLAPVCVCQTPPSHPLLHLVPQLHTRRGKGLVMRVCTTHISSASASRRLIDEDGSRCVY